MTTTAEHPLYKAAVGMMASQRLDVETWEQVARFAAGLNGDDARLQFEMVEEQIKADFHITALPGKWRSAKSAALNAISAGVKLITDEGTVVGKTAVEKAVRKACSTITPLSQGQVMHDACYALCYNTPVPTVWDNPAQRENCIEMLTIVLDNLKAS